MSGILCKIWRFFLEIFTQLLNVIAEAIETVVDVGLDLLGGVADSILSSGPVMLLAALVGGYFLLTALGKKSEKDGNEKPDSIAFYPPSAPANNERSRV